MCECVCVCVLFTFCMRVFVSFVCLFVVLFFLFSVIPKTAHGTVADGWVEETAPVSQADPDNVTGGFRQCHRQIQSQADSDNITGRFRQYHRQIQTMSQADSDLTTV